MKPTDNYLTLHLKFTRQMISRSRIGNFSTGCTRTNIDETEL